MYNRRFGFFFSFLVTTSNTYTNILIHTVLQKTNKQHRCGTLNTEEEGKNNKKKHRSRCYERGDESKCVRGTNEGQRSHSRHSEPLSVSIGGGGGGAIVRMVDQRCAALPFPCTPRELLRMYHPTCTRSNHRLQSRAILRHAQCRTTSLLPLMSLPMYSASVVMLTRIAP